MVVLQEWQVMPSTDSFTSATPDPALRGGGGGEREEDGEGGEEDEEGGEARRAGLAEAGVSGAVATPVTTSPSWGAVVREGTKTTERPPALSLTSSTPWTRDSRARASWAAPGPGPGAGSSRVSVGTGSAELGSGGLDSKPMSSTASHRDAGLWRLGSNSTAALLSSRDTWRHDGGGHGTTKR